MNFLKKWCKFTTTYQIICPILATLGINIIASILEAGGTRIFQVVVDLLPKAKSMKTIYTLGIVYIATCVLYSICFYIGQILRAKLREDGTKKIRRRFSSHILKMECSDLVELPQNEITTVDESIEELVDGSHFVVSNQLAELVFGTAINIGLMLLTNWKFALLMIAVELPISAGLIKSGKKIKPLADRRVETRKVLRGLINRLNFFTSIKSFSREKYEEDMINSGTDDYYDAGYRRKMMSMHYVSRIIISNEGAAIAILLLAIFLVPRGMVTIGEVMLLYLLRERITIPFQLVIDVMDNITSWEAKYEKFEKVMGFSEEPDGEVKLTEFNNSIEFKDVSFAYESDKFVLQNINLTIKKGQKVGIYGPSGGGKSSLIKLINRLYRVNSGAISIDGININDITSKSLRRNIGVVSQAVEIFDGSIKDNILYGTKATEEQMLTASKKAFAHGFVSKLEDGYDTIVGRNGIQLSGGERQRIALARVFLADPDILILDEATSALDNDSERVVQKAIESVEGDGKTVIAIAHRISTIKDYDMLYGIDNHRIVESGTDKQLLQNSNSIWSRYNNLAEEE